MVQIIELLGNKNAIKLIAFFLRNPTLQIYQQEIRKRVKLSKATLIKWLNMLVKQDILRFKEYGRAKVYFLQRENPIVKHLKILDNLFLTCNIKNIADKHEVRIYLYGSAARGEDVENSDIDILITGKIKKEDIIEDIGKISEKIKRQIKAEIFSYLEWSQVAKKDRAFYERVEKDKIEISQNPDRFCTPH